MRALVDHALQALATFGSEGVPQVLGHDLGGDVLDVLAPILRDGGYEVGHEPTEECERPAKVSPFSIEQARDRRQHSQVHDQGIPRRLELPDRDGRPGAGLRGVRFGDGGLLVCRPVEHRNPGGTHAIRGERLVVGGGAQVGGVRVCLGEIVGPRPEPAGPGLHGRHEPGAVDHLAEVVEHLVGRDAAGDDGLLLRRHQEDEPSVVLHCLHEVVPAVTEFIVLRRPPQGLIDPRGGAERLDDVIVDIHVVGDRVEAREHVICVPRFDNPLAVVPGVLLDGIGVLGLETLADQFQDLVDRDRDGLLPTAVRALRLVGVVAHELLDGLVLEALIADSLVGSDRAVALFKFLEPLILRVPHDHDLLRRDQLSAANQPIFPHGAGRGARRCRNGMPPICRLPLLRVTPGIGYYACGSMSRERAAGRWRSISRDDRVTQ